MNRYWLSLVFLLFCKRLILRRKFMITRINVEEFDYSTYIISLSLSLSLDLYMHFIITLSCRFYCCQKATQPNTAHTSSSAPRSNASRTTIPFFQYLPPNFFVSFLFLFFLFWLDGVDSYLFGLRWDPFFFFFKKKKESIIHGLE